MSLRKSITLTAAFVAYACAVEASVSVIAHRGNSSEAPENTLSAFRQAIELRVDAIELDITSQKKVSLSSSTTMDWVGRQITAFL